MKALSRQSLIFLLLKHYHRDIVFIKQTRRGLLQKYKLEKPSEIMSAFDDIQKLEPESNPTTQSLIRILYGYVITNQAEMAENLLISLLEEGKIQKLEVLSILDEAEEFCISDSVGLTPNYWLYRGNIFLIKQDYESAIRCADNALSLDNKFYEAYSVRSIAQGRLGNFKDAFQYLNMAIQMQPDVLLYRSRAVLFALKEDYKKSVFDFTRALRLDSNSIQAYIGRANVYLLMDNKEEQAFHDLDTVIALVMIVILKRWLTQLIPMHC